jgi:hypothetical protein
MDIHVSKENMPLLVKALIAALVVLLLTAFGIAGLFRVWLDEPWHLCLVNAVPLAVISSAIAIPSVGSLQHEKKEFIVYESTFSDVLGIVLFNFMVAHPVLNGQAFGALALDLGVVIAVSVIASLALVLLMARITHGNKFFLILAILIIVFAVGKLAHISTLLLVFTFGVALNNSQFFSGFFGPFIVSHRRLKVELRFLKSITMESAFLIRTYFFVLFGFSISLAQIFSVRIVALGLLIMLLIFAIRAAYLAVVMRSSLFPETFIAPRGLITVLLFYSIPDNLLLRHVGKDVLFVVILGSTLCMAASLIFHGRKHKDEAAQLAEQVEQVT